MRLAAQAKMGYYPTPQNVTDIIKNYLKPGNGIIKILDPCAGEGKALRIIGDHLKAETYGIEIDLHRGRNAKRFLTRVLVTDYQKAKISKDAFSLLWLNPPYDWSVTSGDIQKSERYERIFLRDTIKYLIPGGILVYLIPQNRLDGHVARILSYRFENLKLFRFPEDQYKEYNQLVIFGVLKEKPSKENDVSRYLKDCGIKKAIVPYLPLNPKEIITVPASPIKRIQFATKGIDPKELEQEIRDHGLFDQFKEMTVPLKMVEKIRPIMKLRYGHLAQIIACGFINGVVWDPEHQEPLLIKGATKKEVERSVEVEENLTRYIDRDKILPVIQAFDQNGNLFTIK